jgi:transcriptional regulator with XRE-family HTH domain
MRQDDLAGLLGTTQSSVSGWVNGKYEPSAATVFALERALDVDPGALSRPLGYLPVDSESQAVTVEGAIAQSRQLDDDDKAALAAVYRALLKRRSPLSAGGERPRTQAGTSNRAAVRPRSVAGGR